MKARTILYRDTPVPFLISILNRQSNKKNQTVVYCAMSISILRIFSREYLLRENIALRCQYPLFFHSTNREMNPIHVEEWMFERFPIRVLSWR